MDDVQQACFETAGMTEEQPSGPSFGYTAPAEPPPRADSDNGPATTTSGTSGTSGGGGGGGAGNESEGSAGRPAAAAASSHVQEISQQNIKNRLNEVITEIEREVEHELDREDREELTREERREETTRTAAQETATPPIATPPTTPEPDHQSAPATGGQGETDDQWQPEPADSSQSVSSGVVTEQNSDQSNAAAISNDQSNPEDPLQMSNAKEHATCNAASSAMQAPVGMVSAQAQTDPIAYQAREGHFASPFGSTATSSLPRGWPGSGGVAFALSGHPAPPATAHEAPEQQWAAPTRPHDQWKAREAAASPYATLPRMANAHARGWENQTKADTPKRVHFADTPQVRVLEDDAAQAPEVTRRPRPDAPRGQRPVSAPAAAQMFTIPNMAAKPYGRTSPLVVTPVRRASPLPVLGGGQVEVDACVVDEQGENQEMSSQLPEPEPAIPPAPPVQKTPVPPSKIFTPAHDEPAIPQKKKTMFVDSAFFSPKVHPTWEQQVEMAKRISSSLSDASNKQSKGQSMYDRRKKRSVKWVHGGSQEAEDGGESPLVPKDKPLLQLLMNPHGHVYDLNALRKQGWNIDNKGGLSPEICSDLIKDLNSPTGRGAQIFAKRKKRAEKWVVDEEHREARKAEQSQVDAASQPAPAAPQPPPAAPKPPQPAQAFQQPPVPPVPLQTLYQPPQAPQFPSGGVYAPRTAHSWSAAHEQTETKKFKSTSSKAFSEITQGHSVKNATQTSFNEAHHVNVSSSQSTVTAASQVITTQQSRLTRAMHHEEDKENISSSQVLQTMDTADMSKQDVELKMAEAVFEETARQMEITSCDQSRLSLGSIDLPGDSADLTSGHPSDRAPSDPMEIDPDVSPQLAVLKPIDKPADWAGGVTELVKPTSEPDVVMPALKPIGKPVDWSGPQDSAKPSDDVASEEPKPLVSLKPVNLPPVEKPASREDDEPKPLVLLKPVVKPIDHASNKPAAEEHKPLVSLKPVPKPPTEKSSGMSAAEEVSSPFGARLTPFRPAGGLRQSQLVQQQEAVTSEVTEEVSGVWGRVSAIRDTFDAGSRSTAGSRPPVQVEMPRAPTMAVPNAFHQMPFTYVDPNSAAAAPKFGKSSETGSAASVQQNQQSDDRLVAWGDEDEQAYIEPVEFSSSQSGGITEGFGQSDVMSDARHQSYQTTQSAYQSQSAHSSSEFRQSATDGSTGGWSQQPISAAAFAGEEPISGPEGTDDVMFQCEVALVETTVNQEALQDYLGRMAGEEWMMTAREEPRPPSAPPVPEVTMRQPPPPAAVLDQIDTSQEAAARAAVLAEHQRNRQSWTNYNTAPRGWGNQDHFYRPVTFIQPLMSQ